MKPMKTIYLGLATRQSLTRLKLSFPLDRTPRPPVTIPGMPRLKSIFLRNLDPMCYNDDVSTLLYEAEELERLDMHWNERMRVEREPSVNLHTYFSRLVASPRKLNLKHFGIANLFCRNQSELSESVGWRSLRSVAALNCMNTDDPSTIFIDRTWEVPPHASKNHEHELSQIKVLRLDSPRIAHTKFVAVLKNMEEIYLVQPPKCPSDSSPASSSTLDHPMNGTSSTTSSNSPDHRNQVGSPATTNVPSETSWPPWRNNPLEMAKQVAIASDFLAAISANHGQTLTKLMLASVWSLQETVLTSLLRVCPNLTQLACAMDEGEGNMTMMRFVLRAAPKIRALRILFPPGFDPMGGLGDRAVQVHTKIMEYETSRDEYKNLRWLGIGDTICELCELIKEDGGLRRRVRVVGLDEVQGVEIFRYGVPEL
jgi:hypothetical protein